MKDQITFNTAELKRIVHLINSWEEHVKRGARSINLGVDQTQMEQMTRLRDKICQALPVSGNVG